MNIWQKLVRWYRSILNYVGWRVESADHLIMYVEPSKLDDIVRILHEHGYFYNDFSFRYKGQIYTARKIVGDYQIHICIYGSGQLTAHYELKTEHPSDHLAGVGHRLLTRNEKLAVMRMLRDVEVW